MNVVTVFEESKGSRLTQMACFLHQLAHGVGFSYICHSYYPTLTPEGLLRSFSGFSTVPADTILWR
jgi:hypothetical protein